jgi:hypothetical protein
MSDFDVYVLVHPEIDAATYAVEYALPHDEDDIDVADCWIAERTREAVERCAALVLVTDDLFEVEAHEAGESVALSNRVYTREGEAGIEAQSVRYLGAPFAPPAAAALLADLAGQRVLLGGFHREDCVAKVAQALRGLGCEVTIDPDTTLPRLGSAYLRAC